MDRKKIKSPYAIDPETGKGKALVFEADLSNKSDVEFARDLEAVASTQPQSLQEFITRLVERQKK